MGEGGGNKMVIVGRDGGDDDDDDGGVIIMTKDEVRKMCIEKIRGILPGFMSGYYSSSSKTQSCCGKIAEASGSSDGNEGGVEEEEEAKAAVETTAATIIYDGGESSPSSCSFDFSNSRDMLAVAEQAVASANQMRKRKNNKEEEDSSPGSEDHNKRKRVDGGVGGGSVMSRRLRRTGGSSSGMTITTVKRGGGSGKAAACSPCSPSCSESFEDEDAGEEGFWTLESLMMMVKKRGEGEYHGIIPTWGYRFDPRRSSSGDAAGKEGKKKKHDHRNEEEEATTNHHHHHASALEALLSSSDGKKKKKKRLVRHDDHQAYHEKSKEKGPADRRKTVTRRERVGDEHCDMVITIPARFSSVPGAGEDGKLKVHSWILRGGSRGNAWNVRSSPPFDKVIEVEEKIVRLALQYCYEGVLGKYNDEGGGYYSLDDCGPLLLFSVAIGYEELRDHLYLNPYFDTPPPQPSSGSRCWKEMIHFSTVRCLDMENRRKISQKEKLGVGGSTTVIIGDHASNAAAATSAAQSKKMMVVVMNPSNLEKFCDEYDDDAAAGVDVGYLLGCLRSVPLFVIEEMMYCKDVGASSSPNPSSSRFNPVLAGRFLEIWSTANYGKLMLGGGSTAKNRRGGEVDSIKDEIIHLVSDLQLPLSYVRGMLEVGSNIVSVCTGTPKGDTFLRNKFKYLQICDESTDIRSICYRSDGSPPKFEFTGLPSCASNRFMWPGAAFIAGKNCVMVGWRSFGRLAFGSNDSDRHRLLRRGQLQCTSTDGIALNFSDLNVWGYGPEAYLIPIWGIQRGGEDGGGGGDGCIRIPYAVIRDEPMESIARKSMSRKGEIEEEEDHFGRIIEQCSPRRCASSSRLGLRLHCFERQVCMLISDCVLTAASSSSSSAGGSAGRATDMWEIGNSEDFAPQMMWDGVYADKGCLVGWAPDDSWTYCGTCAPNTVGSFYVLPREGATSCDPVVTGGVRLSSVGCYCIVQGLFGVPWIIYMELDGTIRCVDLLRGGAKRRVSATMPSSSSPGGTFNTSNSICMCSAPHSGQVAILYDGFVSVYSVVVEEGESSSNDSVASYMILGGDPVPGLAFCYNIPLTIPEEEEESSSSSSSSDESSCDDDDDSTTNNNNRRRSNDDDYRKKKNRSRHNNNNSGSSREEEGGDEDSGKRREKNDKNKKGFKGVSISMCQNTLDLYVLDDEGMVYCLHRKEVNRKDALDKFFDGDDTTVHLNPGLERKWSDLLDSIRNRRSNTPKNKSSNSTTFIHLGDHNHHHRSNGAGGDKNNIIATMEDPYVHPRQRKQQSPWSI